MNYEYKGTKAPWEWDGKPWDYDKEEEAPWLVSNKGESIVLQGEIVCAESDAHLISAAPDLLQACIVMTDYCNKHNVIELVPEYEQMIAAIHKALNLPTP